MRDKVLSVKVTSVFERLVHWVMAISCLLLIFSGIDFLFHSINFLFFLGEDSARIMKQVHHSSSAFFLLSIIAAFFTWSGDGFSFSSKDWEWVKNAGGYMGNGYKQDVSGRFNAGQKLFFIGVICIGLLMVATGFMLALGRLLPADWARWAAAFHVLGMALITVSMLAHIYMAVIIEPGALRIVLSGKVPRQWLQNHRPGWLNQLENNRKK